MDAARLFPLRASCSRTVRLLTRSTASLTLRDPEAFITWTRHSPWCAPAEQYGPEITGLRRGYSLAELEVAADRAMKDGVRYVYWLAQPYRRGLSDSRPTIHAYREAYATLKDLPGRAREGQFGAVNRLVGAWDVYRRYPFTICGGVLIAAAPFLSKGN